MNSWALGHGEGGVGHVTAGPGVLRTEASGPDCHLHLIYLIFTVRNTLKTVARDIWKDNN